MTTDSDIAVVSTALRDVASGIEPNPELVRIVRRHGRARRRRRNALYVATAAVLALAVAGGAVQWYMPFGKADRGPGWADTWTGTQGDLIGDQAYLNSVKAAWKGSHQASANASRGIFDDLRGEPEIKWAAHTPAGRAAVVTQRARLHRHGALAPDDAGRMATLVGFVSDIDGRPTVVDDDYGPGGTPEVTGFFAGADRSTLIVIDFAESLQYSIGREYHPDGTVTRDWKPLPFQQGVAVVTTPKGVAASGVRVAADPAQPLAYRLANTGDQWTYQDHRLQWKAGFQLTGPDTPQSVEAGQQACEALSSADSVGVDLLGYAGFNPLWCATGTTPDGRSVVVGEKQIGDDPSYLYYALGSGAAIRYGNAGPVDASKPVPVLFALPDRQGFVAVRKDATLRYRVGNGAWQGERRNAALLPPEATEVQVTPAGGQATIVPIK
ncbi:hypothetical protein AB0M46_07985 [Dactylosporangium sp. NPDC051485]|uniref:hypothetical protein n=1 Tax=Dactylosporangium sp. NPDC051485 TaxID=3154846 RepID=UPI0034405227